jgi:hypothetical protein
MTLFPSGGHNAWQATYGLQEMWTWLYDQTRPPAPTITIGTPQAAPSSARVNSGARIRISAPLTVSSSAPLAEVTVDLKILGGPYAATMVYNTGTEKYEYDHVLPTSGLKVGRKGIGITAVDSKGNRTVAFTEITLTQ